MRAVVSEALPFAPTPAVLRAVLAELAAAGSASGGAIAVDDRAAALAAYRSLARRVPDLPPRWRHRDALRQFADLVWTTGRLPLPAGRARRADALVRESPQAEAPSALAVASSGGLVHVGSTLLAPPAEPASDDPRFVLRSLADAARAWPKRVAAIHRRVVRPNADAYVALSNAFQNCGAYVEIAEGAILDDPLQLIWTAQPAIANAIFPQVVVRVRPGARATIVERHLGESDSFVAGTVEIDVAPGAELDYVVLGRVDGGIRSSFVRAARVGAGGAIRWHLADFGSALGRSVTRARLVGDGARAEVDAIFCARAFEHVDARVEVVHVAPRTRSRTIVRAAAIDRAQVRLGGKVRVVAGAVGTRASFREDALDLAERAYVDARPTLEVGAHDVGVAHAANVGGLDEAGLFYAQTRGLARGAAAKMIALAFFESALAGFPGETMRDEVRTTLDERLDDIGDTFET